jgi:hypothetical protein
VGFGVKDIIRETYRGKFENFAREHAHEMTRLGIWFESILKLWLKLNKPELQALNHQAGSLRAVRFLVIPENAVLGSLFRA